MLVALTVLLVVATVRQLRRRGVASARAARAPGDAGASAPDAALPHLRAAGAAAEAGDFLAAAHALYAGVVLWLDAAHALRWDESTTGAEYARALAGGPHEPPFRALLAAFDPVAWGARPDVAGAYARMRTAATTMGVPR
jgi:hypothetical protein